MALGVACQRLDLLDPVCQLCDEALPATSVYAFLHTQHEVLFPDGMFADLFAALRVREGGEVVEQIDAGDLDVVACGHGGDDGHTLFLGVTPDHRLPPQEAAKRRPVRILTCRVDVPAPAAPDRKG